MEKKRKKRGKKKRKRPPTYTEQKGQNTFPFFYTKKERKRRTARLAFCAHRGREKKKRGRGEYPILFPVWHEGRKGEKGGGRRKREKKEKRSNICYTILNYKTKRLKGKGGKKGKREKGRAEGGVPFTHNTKARHYLSKYFLIHGQKIEKGRGEGREREMEASYDDVRYPSPYPPLLRGEKKKGHLVAWSIVK